MNKDYSIEYAKSNRSKCRGCEETIVKGEVRVSKKDYESEEARKFGGLDRWHHLDCFAKLRSELTFFCSGMDIPGANDLTAEDKDKLNKALPKIKEEDLPSEAKKIKSESKEEEDKEEKKMKQQNKDFYKLRDKIESLSKKLCSELLESNKQAVPVGISQV